MDNRYDDSPYQNLIKQMKTELKRMRKDLNEEDGNYPHIQKVIDEYWN